MKVQLWIFAGPNGAGKSSLVLHHVRGRMPIVNPDEIARSLPKREGEPAVIEAGRFALLQRESYLAERCSFGVETTFTGHGEVNLMRRARNAGYYVTLVFVGLKNVQLSASRVRSRVRDGGHDVPMADVLRRFDRSMANLAVGLTIADRAYVIDNSERRRRLLVSRENGREAPDQTHAAMG